MVRLNVNHIPPFYLNINMGSTQDSFARIELNENYLHLQSLFPFESQLACIIQFSFMLLIHFSPVNSSDVFLLLESTLFLL